MPGAESKVTIPVKNFGCRTYELFRDFTQIATATSTSAVVDTES